MARGDDVVCVDNLASGFIGNIQHLFEWGRFHFIEGDIRDALTVAGKIDAVANLASLASPPVYLAHPIFTLTTSSTGTQRLLDLAAANGARFLQASTSEVYGDPEVHPQVEEYWGNVNPIGPRSVYDEGKRYAEALVTAYRQAGLDAGIVRIFNTYGPRMHPADGRVVTNFIRQALCGEPITVYGDGRQTRSLCFVSDLVAGLVAMLDGSVPGPVNLGNPTEMTVGEIAELIVKLTGSSSPIVSLPLPTDDPRRRRPNIDKARRELGWEPVVGVSAGLQETIAWHVEQLPDSAQVA